MARASRAGRLSIPAIMMVHPVREEKAAALEKVDLVEAKQARVEAVLRRQAKEKRALAEVDLHLAKGKQDLRAGSK